MTVASLAWLPLNRDIEMSEVIINVKQVSSVGALRLALRQPNVRAIELNI
jgi:hypothetical protein